jgi:hypothetical protein
MPQRLNRTLLSKIFALAALLSIPFFTFTEAKAEGDRYIKDDDQVHSIEDFRIRSLVFLKPMNLSDPLYIQNGQIVSKAKVKSQRPYCSIQGTSNMSERFEVRSGPIVFNKGDRIQIHGILSTRNVKTELNLDPTSMQFDRIKNKKVDTDLRILLMMNPAVNLLERVYLDENRQSPEKRTYPKSHSYINAELNCAKLPDDPTVGQLRDILGRNFIRITPDLQEPAIARDQNRVFQKRDSQKDNEEILKAMNESLQMVAPSSAETQATD